jgi:hypothetical protein
MTTARATGHPHRPHVGMGQHGLGLVIVAHEDADGTRHMVVERGEEEVLGDLVRQLQRLWGRAQREAVEERRPETGAVAQQGRGDGVVGLHFFV